MSATERLDPAGPTHPLVIGVDIGGTFTDVVLHDPVAGRLFTCKVSSTPSDPAAGFFAGLDRALDVSGASPGRVGRILHGSTVATNAVLEGTGSRVGLLTTEGFRDILEIGRAYIPGIFTNYMRWEKPERLVPLELVRQVPERLDARGEVVRPFDARAARAAINELIECDIEALAIAFLHSYANPSHERAAAAIAAELAPGLFVSCSSDVLPEYREYERTLTTVLNAYVMPAVARYLGAIAEGLAPRGIAAGFYVVRSDAGVMSVSAARERPVNIVLSGPAGGVKGATWLAREAGFPNVLTIDMGGTSTDVSLSVDAEPRLSTERWVSHYPVSVPIVDITTIGAGGGSIAYVSPAGALRVGPRSAGAEPGPACYGRGGEEPTVTDANLVLGRLPEELAGGEIVLDIERARAAIDARIARPLGLGIEDAAYGILRIVNENMLGALRVVSVQRGIDPRDLALVPFGGAGPVHGADLARLAGIATLLVPPAPGVLSALGFLLADIRQVFSQTRVGVIGRLDIAAYAEMLRALAGQAEAWLAREGVPPGARALEVALDLRYRGQAHELSLPVAAPLDASAFEHARERFHREHRLRYGFDQPFAEVEVVNLRVTATGRLAKPRFEHQAEEDAEASDARFDVRPVYFAGRMQPTAFYARSRLRPGNWLRGPAVVVQPDCTTVVGPGDRLHVDGYGNLVIRIAGGTTAASHA